MKYINLLILVCVCSMHAQNVQITDPNFENALIALNMDSGTPDGVIDATKVMYVKNLDISNKNITDLTGISAFVNLEKIDASKNQLTQADFSANLYLKEAVLHNNQLTSVNITNNVWLTTLNLYKNELVDINLINNRNLEYLAIANNNLTSLSLTTNRRLETIYCQFNNISDLSVLDMQNLKTLNFEENNVVSFDMTNATALEQVIGAHNFISTVETGSNTNLQYLNLMFNSLESLDLSANTKLATLMAAHNQLNSLNIRNGNNKNMAVFSIEDNPDLSCVTADNNTVDANGSPNAARWNHSTDLGFSADCSTEFAQNTTQFDVYLDHSKQLNISSPTNGVANLYGLNGNTVLTSSVNEGNQALNLSKLNSSIYILKVVGDQGSFTKKIVLR